MAAKRLSKSSVDWTKAFGSVSPAEAPALRSFKARQDAFISRINKYPESIKPIDFTAYKTKVGNPALVDMLEKEYKALQVPYPQDKDNLSKKVDVLEKAKADGNVLRDSVLKDFVKVAEEYLVQSEKVPGLDVMTRDAYRSYFPGMLREPNLVDPGLMMASAKARKRHEGYPPFQSQYYVENLKHWFDWYFLRGDYADAYKKVNAHMDEAKVEKLEVAEPEAKDEKK